MGSIARLLPHQLILSNCFKLFIKTNKCTNCSLDAEGELEDIHYSGAARDSVFNVPLEMVQPFYKAYRKLEDMFNDSSNCIKYKMKNGKHFC